MDAITKQPIKEADTDLESELENWDWARTAGMSADELRDTLRAAITGPELRRAA